MSRKARLWLQLILLQMTPFQWNTACVPIWLYQPMQVSVVAPDALTQSCHWILGSWHTGLCIWQATIIVVNFIARGYCDFAIHESPCCTAICKLKINCFATTVFRSPSGLAVITYVCACMHVSKYAYMCVWYGVYFDFMLLWIFKSSLQFLTAPVPIFSNVFLLHM